MEDGKIVEIVRVSAVVGFSKDIGWVCICTEIGKKSSGSVRWIPISTRFVWVKEFVV